MKSRIAFGVAIVSLIAAVGAYGAGAFDRHAVPLVKIGAGAPLAAPNVKTIEFDHAWTTTNPKISVNTAGEISLSPLATVGPVYASTTAGKLASEAQLNVTRGGTGLAAGTSGGVPYYASTTTMGSSALLTQYGAVYGGGVGAAPAAAAVGSAGDVLMSNASSAPTMTSTLLGLKRIRYGDSDALVIGADTGNLTSLTNSTTKNFGVSTPHYLNAEENVTVFRGANDSTTNNLDIGGGSGSVNAMTNIKWWTAAANNTLSGTTRGQINSAGQWAIGSNAPNTGGTRGEKLLVSGNTLAINMSNTENNSTNKDGLLSVSHFTTAEEPVTLIYGLSTTSASTVMVGGGYSGANAASAIEWYTAGDNTTLAGTRRASINSTGLLRYHGATSTALSNGMAGIEFEAAGMNTTSKYTPAVKFTSADSDFTTNNPKFLAGIVGRATQTYGSDTAGGMDIDFITSPGNPGATPTLAATASLDGSGNFSTTGNLLVSGAGGAGTNNVPHTYVRRTTATSGLQTITATCTGTNEKVFGGGCDQTGTAAKLVLALPNSDTTFACKWDTNPTNGSATAICMAY